MERKIYITDGFVALCEYCKETDDMDWTFTIAGKTRTPKGDITFGAQKPLRSSQTVSSVQDL